MPPNKRPRRITFPDEVDLNRSDDENLNNNSSQTSNESNSTFNDMNDEQLINIVAAALPQSTAIRNAVSTLASIIQSNTYPAVESISRAVNTTINAAERNSILENIRSELVEIQEIAFELLDGSWQSVCPYLVNLSLSTVPTILDVQIEELAPIIRNLLPNRYAFEHLGKINERLRHDNVASRNFILLFTNKKMRFPYLSEAEKRKTLLVIQRRNLRKLPVYRTNNPNKYRNIIMCLAYMQLYSHRDCRKMGIILLYTLKYEIIHELDFNGPIMTISENLSEIILSVAMLNGEIVRRKLLIRLNEIYLFLVDTLHAIMGLSVKSYAHMMWTCDIIAYGKAKDAHSKYYMSLLEGVAADCNLLEVRRSHHIHFAAAKINNNVEAFLANPIEESLPRRPMPDVNIRRFIPENFILF